MSKPLANLLAEHSLMGDMNSSLKKVLTAHDKFFRKLSKDDTYYTYLLLDFNQFNGKAIKGVSFAEFIESVIYVGQGAGCRVLHHYWDTLIWNLKEGKKCPNIVDALQKLIPDDKLRFIRSERTSTNECLSKHGAMINVLGLPNLLNQRHGAIYGKWSDDVLRKMPELDRLAKNELLGIACLRQFYKSLSFEMKGFEKVPRDEYFLECYKMGVSKKRSV